MTIRFIGKVPTGWDTTSALRCISFPGGERHLISPEAFDETAVAAWVPTANMQDLLDLGLWANFVHQRGQRAVAILPYLPAARADHGIDREANGAAVYAGILNSFDLDQVIVFDAHSPVMPSLINNVTAVPAETFAYNAIFPQAIEGENTAADAGYVGVIAPDKGAVDRARRFADRAQLPVYTATKHRDPATGKLSGFQCDGLPDTGRLIVFDDICDGGGTFMGLAAATGLTRDRLTLWVSHGVFSGKADQLREHYGEIYTTDSHAGAARTDVDAHIASLLPYLMTFITKN